MLHIITFYLLTSLKEKNDVFYKFNKLKYMLNMSLKRMINDLL